MKKLAYIVTVILTTLVVSQVQADPTWYTISFTGADMFNYTSTVDELYNQDAPRRERNWDGDTILSTQWSDIDSDTDGTNDFAEWASGNLATYGFSYFNLYGATIASDYWDQPYHAVPDQDNGEFGADSWRNQTVNGVPVHTGMGSDGVWDGGIVLANQSYNPTDYAFPVWRAPNGTQLTKDNAASLLFSVDVLMENYSTAFEPDGRLRVWFGGFDQPQGTELTTEVAGVMMVPVPAAVLLGMLGLGAAGMKLRKFV